MELCLDCLCPRCQSQPASAGILLFSHDPKTQLWRSNRRYQFGNSLRRCPLFYTGLARIDPNPDPSPKNLHAISSHKNVLLILTVTDMTKVPPGSFSRTLPTSVDWLKCGALSLASNTVTLIAQRPGRIFVLLVVGVNRICNDMSVLFSFFRFRFYIETE